MALRKNEKLAQHQVLGHALDFAGYELVIQVFLFREDPGHKIEIGRQGAAKQQEVRGRSRIAVPVLI
jgi:hypothetical protein